MALAVSDAPQTMTKLLRPSGSESITQDELVLMVRGWTGQHMSLHLYLPNKSTQKNNRVVLPSEVIMSARFSACVLPVGCPAGHSYHIGEM